MRLCASFAQNGERGDDTKILQGFARLRWWNRIGQLKADLAVQIIRAIRQRALTQHQAAALVGLKQPDISNICNARLAGISIERLFLVLNRLGRSIEIHISPEEREDAATVVLAA